MSRFMTFQPKGKGDGYRNAIQYYVLVVLVHGKGEEEVHIISNQTELGP